MLSTVYLGLGGNLGDTLRYLQQAIDVLHDRVGLVNQVSSVYKTQAWGFDSDDFLNIVVELKTVQSPEQLLDQCLQIELDLGRVRSQINQGYQARTIDIDVLLYDDVVVSTKKLCLPHPHIISRRFVLDPLEEIASNTFHPLLKQSIGYLSKVSSDESAISKTTLKLIKPKTIADSYQYIVVEGNIGVGKSSLTKQIAQDFDVTMVFEQFSGNPFLPKFYQDKERYALPLEMSFLVERCQQISDSLIHHDLFKSPVISDYYVLKSLIFAQITLSKDEYLLYRRIFNLMYKKIIKPDLYIYLNQSIPRLLDNIKKRGRVYEQNISSGYLQNIQKEYTQFVCNNSDLHVLNVDVSSLDFVNNPNDYTAVLRTILK